MFFLMFSIKNTLNHVIIPPSALENIPTHNNIINKPHLALWFNTIVDSDVFSIIINYLNKNIFLILRKKN